MPEALSVAFPRVECMIESALAPVRIAELELLLSRLAAPSPASTDPDRIDRLRAMERVKNALAAAQATESVAFDTSQRTDQVEAGWGEHRVGRGIADQVALARMESPHKGSRLLGLAKALVHEMPECLAALRRGDVSEWRVTCVARETAHLRVEDRRAVDAEIGPRLATMGDRQAAGAARAMAQRLDPAGAAERARRAERERRVSIRPAPDAMTYVTALLPMRDGVSVFAALTRLAKDAVADGDDRGRGQIMADALVERITGHAVGAVPIRINLVMSDTTLLGADCTPAAVPGHGTMPAEVARAWVRATIAARVVSIDDLVTVRRLFTSPDARDLVAMESTKRTFTGLLRHMLELRDQTCRTPWCEAPLRHGDHVRRSGDGGATSLWNARGACVRCNQAREAPGWSAKVSSGPDETHEVALTTPTGHDYTSQAPPLLPGRPARPPSEAVRSRSGPQDARAG
jgi:hypothetical protein